MENEFSTSTASISEPVVQVKEAQAPRTRRPRGERSAKQAEKSAVHKDSSEETAMSASQASASQETPAPARSDRMIPPPPMTLTASVQAQAVSNPAVNTPVNQQSSSSIQESTPSAATANTHQYASNNDQQRSHNQGSSQGQGSSSNGYNGQESRVNGHHQRRKDSRHDGRQDRGRDRNDFRSNNNRRDRNHNQRQGHSRRDRPEMMDDEDSDNFVIDLDLNDPRIVRISDLQRMSADQLIHFAKQSGVEFGTSSLTKSQIVFELVKAISQSSDDIIVGEGTLEVLPDGYGFLRSPIYNYLSSVEDIYISPTQVRRLDLRKGDTIVGTIRSPKEKEKYFALAKVHSINGVTPSAIRERALFENLTPLYPQERLVMETEKSKFAGRVIDLASPVGKGQRGIVVAPPKSGKTVILQQIANSIATNDPEAKLIMLLIDERPEEVTDMQRTVRGEVIASTFDEPPERHVQVCEMVIEKAKRLVEFGHDVIILLDSLTRLARAYNTVQPHSGKILSGGIDANALHKPKRFFGAARNVEEGGSLTIIATALIETGSRMDEVIFEEFKGTGNMEIVLDRRLADRRIWPAIDVIRSGTRKEDLLYHPNELEKIYLFRQAIADLSPIDAMNLLVGRLKKTSSNVEFLLSLKD